MNQRRIWIVGDDTGIAARLSEPASALGYVVEKKVERTVRINPEAMPALIVLSVFTLGMAGLNLLVTTKRLSRPLPVVIVAAQHQTRVVVEALKLGAADAVVAPVDPKHLLATITSLLRREQQTANPSLKPKISHRAELDTQAFNSQSPKMAQVWNIAKMVAQTDVPILILGESGVGKEVVARFIHRHSRRVGQPLVKVNCAALPRDLLESELFGYERGAFTGAVGEKPGKFELANQGSIVLDEIGEMPRDLQAKLLHVLEDGEFCRLGGKRSLKVDVRILALTNRKLEEAVPRGQFRDDLYFRLNVVTLSIPPLRERKEDIPFLCDYFAKKHRDALGSAIDELPSGLMDKFMRYDWPGNVRQLENAIKRHLILPEQDMELIDMSSAVEARESLEVSAAASGPVFAVSDGAKPAAHLPAENDFICLKSVIAKLTEETERQMVLHVLGQTNWNRRLAAQRLNICYKGLLNKLKSWQIEARRNAAA